MSCIAGAAQLTFSTIRVTSRSQVTSTSLARASGLGAALPDEASMPAQSSRAQSSAHDNQRHGEDNINCIGDTKLQSQSLQDHVCPAVL